MDPAVVRFLETVREHLREQWGWCGGDVHYFPHRRITLAPGETDELRLHRLDHVFVDRDGSPWYRNGTLRKSAVEYTFSFVDSGPTTDWRGCVQSCSLVLQFRDTSRPAVVQWERYGSADPPIGRLKRNDEAVVADGVTLADGLTSGTDLLLSRVLGESADRYEVRDPPPELTARLVEEGWLTRLQPPSDR
ncbi:MAG: hypothetical protein ABEI75_05195 [Halobaculum sp.]